MERGPSCHQGDGCQRRVLPKTHVPGAVNIPLHELSEHVSDLPEDRDTPVLTVCERGNISLSSSSVLFLTSLGYRMPEASPEEPTPGGRWVSPPSRRNNRGSVSTRRSLATSLRD